MKKFKVDHTKLYFDQLTEERKSALMKLRNVILDNLPKGFIETITNELIEYVVPHTLYPEGYHCDPNQPLPFMSIVSQKNYISFYHMGLYADASLLKWFTSEYPKYCKTKLNMGKSCIRFKKADDIPFELLGSLIGKMSAEKWIKLYELNIKKTK